MRSKSVPGVVRECKKIEVLYIRYLDGDGTDGNVYRVMEQWRTLDGKLIYEKDPCYPEKPVLR